MSAEYDVCDVRKNHLCTCSYRDMIEKLEVLDKRIGDKNPRIASDYVKGLAGLIAIIAFVAAVCALGFLGGFGIVSMGVAGIIAVSISAIGSLTSAIILAIGSKPNPNYKPDDEEYKRILCCGCKK